ncbi:SPP1 phage holin family protein [Salmonella enterica]|uniref:SPP1 phage holin family protein n=1 Tax=Salmonella enterica TaxID=28901 RepID=UPI000C228B97|nr:SPP1 phage holin family protein [Salmonella enterica]PJH64375.1 phage holin [Salmonella enterica subsp. enterica serovar Enteritidis]
MNLKGITKGTWVRTVALFLVLINQIAVSFFGFDLGLADEQIYQGVSTVVTVITSLLAGYKNNSVTKPAQEADVVLKQKKKAKGNQ